jgi:mannosyl-3-phosphoglycerate phosphatase family protein
MPRVVFFSDMDATLLDAKTYDLEDARPALQALRDRAIPLVFVTSKTRAEVEYFRELLNNQDPFIVENGAAVYIPKGWFPFEVPKLKDRKEYWVLELGVPRERILKVLRRAFKEVGKPLKGFDSMGENEVALLTGLPLSLAKLSKEREYDEPLVVDSAFLESRKHLESFLARENLSLIMGGRFVHVLGPNDKGRAVCFLLTLFRRLWPEVLSVGLGDSPNDIPLLKAVDVPFIIPNPHIQPSFMDELLHARRVPHPAPLGFREAVERVFSEFC